MFGLGVGGNAGPIRSSRVVVPCGSGSSRSEGCAKRRHGSHGRASTPRRLETAKTSEANELKVKGSSKGARARTGGKARGNVEASRFWAAKPDEDEIRSQYVPGPRFRNPVRGIHGVVPEGALEVRSLLTVDLCLLYALRVPGIPTARKLILNFSRHRLLHRATDICSSREHLISSSS